MVFRHPHAIGKQAVGGERLVIRLFQQRVVEPFEAAGLAPLETEGVEGVETAEAEESRLTVLRGIRVDVVEVLEILAVLRIAVFREAMGFPDRLSGGNRPRHRQDDKNVHQTHDQASDGPRGSMACREGIMKTIGPVQMITRFTEGQVSRQLPPTATSANSGSLFWRATTTSPPPARRQVR